MTATTTKRETTRYRVDCRWVAALILPTGKTLALVQDWKPSHWDNDNRQIVDQAKARADELRRKYGIDGIAIRIMRETRATTDYTVTETSSTLHSMIPEATT